MEVLNLQRVKQADLIVGIPSYNEAGTIGFVVKQASRGLKEHFPKLKSVIINVDNCSPDGTREAFLKSKSDVPLIYAATPKGTKGKGLNFHNLFSLFRELKAKTGVVVDADLKSIEPIWIKKLAGPILSSYGYVSPFYARRKDDATITNQIVYPLVYGLLGADIRQPIGGEFAFSNKLVDIWLNQEWHQSINQFGIDIFMSLNAILSGVKICQVNLGEKVHKSSTPNLGPMFIQVARTLFGILQNNLDKIKKVNKIKKTPIFDGENIPKIKNTIPDYSNFERLFKDEFDLNKEWFKRCLSEPLDLQIKKMEKGEISIDLETWTKIIYDFLYCYDRDKNSEIIEALRCLYFGRVAYSFKRIADFTPAQSEEEVLNQAQHFFQNRSYYLDKYL